MRALWPKGHDAILADLSKEGGEYIRAFDLQSDGTLAAGYKGRAE